MPNHSASSSSSQLERGGLRLFRIGFSWGGVTSRIMAYDSVPRASGDVGRNLVLRAWWRVKRPRGWLFPGQQPSEALTARQLNRVVHAAATAAGLTKRVSMHTLRHSFATHLLERKTDIRVIQVLLGHRKIDTTALYTRVALNTVQAVESPLAHLRPKAPPPT